MCTLDSDCFSKKCVDAAGKQCKSDETPIRPTCNSSETALSVRNYDTGAIVRVSSVNRCDGVSCTANNQCKGGYCAYGKCKTCNKFTAPDDRCPGMTCLKSDVCVTLICYGSECVNDIPKCNSTTTFRVAKTEQIITSVPSNNRCINVACSANTDCADER